MRSVLALILLFRSLCHSLQPLGEAQCPLRYQYESPPTGLECHAGRNTILSQLHCRVAIPCSARAEIQWYHIRDLSNYGTRVDNTSSYATWSYLEDSNLCSTNSAEAEDNLMIVVSELIIFIPSHAHEGYYWCKIVVINDTDAIQKPLQPSECIKLEFSIPHNMKCITHRNRNRWDCADVMPTRCSVQMSIDSWSSAAVTFTTSSPFVSPTSISAYGTAQSPTSQLNKPLSVTGCTASGIPCYAYAVIAFGALALFITGGVAILLLLLCLRARKRKQSTRSLQHDHAHSAPSSRVGNSSLTDMSHDYTSSSLVTRVVSESEIDMTESYDAVKDDPHIYSSPRIHTREKGDCTEHGNTVTLPAEMCKDTGTYCNPDSVSQKMNKEYKALDYVDYTHMYSKPILIAHPTPHTPSSESVGYKSLEPGMMDHTSVYAKPGQ